MFAVHVVPVPCAHRPTHYLCILGFTWTCILKLLNHFNAMYAVICGNTLVRIAAISVPPHGWTAAVQSMAELLGTECILKTILDCLLVLMVYMYVEGDLEVRCLWVVCLAQTL